MSTEILLLTRENFMHHKSNDFFVGCVVLALIAGLTLLAGREALIYTGSLFAGALSIFFLLNLGRKYATVIAIILMPAILFSFFLPKKLRGQLNELKGKKEAESQP